MATTAPSATRDQSGPRKRAAGGDNQDNTEAEAQTKSFALLVGRSSTDGLDSTTPSAGVRLAAPQPITPAVATVFHHEMSLPAAGALSAAVFAACRLALRRRRSGFPWRPCGAAEPLSSRPRTTSPSTVIADHRSLASLPFLPFADCVSMPSVRRAHPTTARLCAPSDMASRARRICPIRQLRPLQMREHGRLKNTLLGDCFRQPSP
jgi:hypothetical protein